MRIGIASILFIICSCQTPRISTAWKTASVAKDRYFNILVVAVLPDADTLLRKKIETDAAQLLNTYGYHAVSALSRFGPKGLSASSQEETWLKLCTNGIDAVMTFAIIPENENLNNNSGQYLRPHSYFYNRIWNYKKMQTSLNFNEPETRYYWETIVFDLLTLQAVGIIRTRSFQDYHYNKITADVTNLVINKMGKEKVIPQRKRQLKAF